MSTLLLAFANSQKDPLPTLQKEYNEVMEVLDERQSKGHFKVRPIPFADKDNLTRVLYQWKDDIELFLFSGHADSNHLKLLESEAKAEGVAALLHLCPNLKIVILNGCSTRNQVSNFLESGIPIIIATNATVNDEKATRFSITFFRALAHNNASIREAYQLALAAAKLEGTINNEIGNRGVITKNKTKVPLWGLYYLETEKELIDTWRLPSQKTTLLTRLPVVEDKIVGRSNEIKTLFNQLHQSQGFVLINGIGGIGKTTTAIAYTNKFKAHYRNIVWVEQTGDFSTAMTTNTVLNQHLGFNPSNDPVADTQLILNKLSNLSGKSLLIIDNANMEVASFKDYLPKAPTWQVLITSRQEMSFANILQLGFLSPESAMELFYTNYQLDKNDELIVELLKTIDYHTLTIELLAKTFQYRQISSIEKILELLQERGLDIGRKVGFNITHSKGKKIEKLFPYLKTIFELGRMESSEIYLLKQFIGLPPIFITGIELLALLGIDEIQEKRWDEVIESLRNLKNKGWLIYKELEKEGKKEPSYKMHRIIQDVLEEKLKPSYEDLKDLIRGITNKLHINDNIDNPVEKLAFIPYGERLRKLVDDKSKEFGNFLSSLMKIHSLFGNYKISVELGEKILIRYKNLFGPENQKTTQIQTALGEQFRQLGEFDRAKILHESALASNIKNLGSNHPDTLTSRFNLATVHWHTQNYHEAAKLVEKILSIDIENHGEDHPDTVKSYSFLGLIYKSLGRYKDSLKYLELALSKDLKHYGEEHPRISIRRANLGSLFRTMNENKKALEQIQLALNLNIKNYGEFHTDTARILAQEGMVYKELGDSSKAKEKLTKAYKIFNSSLGEDNLHTKKVKKILETI